jgi:hypothetical protein
VPPTQRCIETETGFRIELVVANLEREIAEVSTEEIQLLERRVSRRPGEAEGERDCLGGPDE